MRQGLLRGGREAPLSGQDIEAKFLANAGYGGCKAPQAVLETCRRIGSMQGDYRLIRQLGDKA